MTLQKKIEKYSSYFEVGTRNDESKYTFLKDDAPTKLKDAVRKAHGDRFPDDFVYDTFSGLLERLSEYTIDSIGDIENYRHEIVDAYVDIYTHDLIKWLASDINNVYYMTQAIEEFGVTDGFQVLSTAQYIAIDEVMSNVINLFE